MNSFSRGALTLRVPAKINLNLRVGPRRDDGFHPLLSWFCTVGLFDTLNIRWKQAAVPTMGKSPEIHMACDRADLPCDHRNLVYRAAVAVIEQANVPQADSWDIRLEKRIPSGAGLGGGSADAAFAMQGVNRLLNRALGQEKMLELAATLGSDVPFFLHGASAVCKGRGEQVCLIDPPARAKWVSLVLPPIEMPTPAVYRRFDELNLGRQEDVEREPDWPAWVAQPAGVLLPLLINDLEAPAFSLRPDLGTLRQEIEAIAQCPVRMSGSGSSLFTLFDEEAKAKAATQEIEDRFGAQGVKALTVELCPRDYEGSSKDECLT